MHDRVITERFDAIYEATHKIVGVYIGTKYRRVVDVCDIF